MVEDGQLLDGYIEVPHRLIPHPTFKLFCCWLPIFRQRNFSGFLNCILPRKVGSWNSGLDPVALYPLDPWPGPGPTRWPITWAIVPSSVDSISFSFSTLYRLVVFQNSSPFLALSSSMTLPWISYIISIDSVCFSWSSSPKLTRTTTAVEEFLIFWSWPLACPSCVRGRRLFYGLGYTNLFLFILEKKCLMLL